MDGFASLLDGSAVSAGGGTVTCVGVYDGAYAFYASACPKRGGHEEQNGLDSVRARTARRRASGAPRHRRRTLGRNVELTWSTIEEGGASTRTTSTVEANESRRACSS